MATQYGPRRFIAGAVCPRCAEMDKIVMYRVSDTEQVRECVKCGFKDAISDTQSAAPEEPATRVNQPRVGEQALPHEEPVSVVKLLDPRDGKTRKDH